jgi:hypothetical protein
MRKPGSVRKVGMAGAFLYDRVARTLDAKEQR